MQAKLITFCFLLMGALSAINCLTNVIDVSSSAFSNAVGKQGGAGDYPSSFTFEDYFLIYDTDDLSQMTLKIYKFDAGINDYVSWANYSVKYFNNIFPATNGKWFGTYDGDFSIALFQLGSPNTSDITPTFFENPAGPIFYGIRIMPDDSVVAVYSELIYTYIFDGSSWVRNNTLEVNTLSMLYDLTDTHFLNWDLNGGFKIYVRNQQLGWDLIEDHATDPSYQYHLTNGPPTRANLIDPQTVMLRSPSVGDPRDSNAVANGFVIIISKVNVTWMDQIIVAADMPSQYPTNTFGATAIALDSNNVLIGVPQEDYSSPGKRSTEGARVGNYGKAYLLQRGVDNKWQANAKFSRTDRGGYLAGGFGANDKKGFIVACDFRTPSGITLFDCYPHSFDKCIIAAPNVTCKDVVLPDCTDVDLTSLDLFTQNDPECGVASVVKYSGIRVMDNKIFTTLSIARPLATTAPVTCEASVTCPVVYAPVAPVAPVSVSVPVAVSSPTKKTSGVDQLSAVTVGVLTIVSLLL